MRILNPPRTDPGRHRVGPGTGTRTARPPVVTPRDSFCEKKNPFANDESYLLDVESGGGTGEKGSNGELHFDCIILLGY